MKTFSILVTSLLLAGFAATAAAQPPHIARKGATPRQADYQPVNCEKAPKEAITHLKGPAAAYALVYCTPTGHTVAPPDGYLWFPIDQPGQLFLFAAATKKEGDTGRAWFSKQTSRVLKASELKQVNEELVKGYKIDRSFNNVVELDVTAADGQVFNIFFFIEQARTAYVLGCVNSCNTSVLLREYSFEEAKKVTSK